MPDDFLIARNPDEGSSLPYLVRIPLGEHGIVLKSKDTWPRTSKVYCHRADEWPADADVVERVATRVCVRRGAAIELVLDRARESRSQFVLTHVKGREAIFWQSARTAKQARPAGRIPTARAATTSTSDSGPLEILVDAHERYAWHFGHQQVTTRKQRLDVGDYAVELDGRVVAAVERKSLEDLTSSLLNGRLRYALAELSGIPRAAVVVEERYSRVFSLTHVRPAVLADAIAECQARHPSVPVVFAETRALAQEWTYRFLAAALREVDADSLAVERMDRLAAAGPLPEAEPSTAVVRAWALEQGLPVSDRGRLRPDVWDAYRARR
ncbi:MAG: ERCC4 domain-containing protein [Terrabacter sp.]